MSYSERLVVVTGAGVCCNMGDDLPAIESELRCGRAKPFDAWAGAADYHLSSTPLVGLYRGEIAVDKQYGRFMGRAAKLAYQAARKALEQSGLTRRDIGVIASGGTGDVATHREVEQKLAATHNCRKVSPTAIPRLMSSTVSANLATIFKTSGPSFSASAACATGAYNILLAAELIRNGHIEAALAGGVEVCDGHFHAGFEAMRASNSEGNTDPRRASRPYARDRAGLVFGEGAGIVVLETREHAEARGARILGTVVGYGMTSDGSGEMVAPRSEGAHDAMQRALRHSGLGPADIDYINTHGTSTPLGDLSEVRAIRRLFAERLVAYSSTKGYTGHTISAAGAIEAIFTLSMLRQGWIAPSVNADPLDAELTDYPPVLAPTARPLKYALSNSFGFGGTNVSLVLGGPPA